MRPPQVTHVTVDPSRSAPFGVLSSSALVPLGDAASCAKARPLKRFADLGEQVARDQRIEDRPGLDADVDLHRHAGDREHP